MRLLVQISTRNFDIPYYNIVKKIPSNKRLQSKWTAIFMWLETFTKSDENAQEVLVKLNLIFELVLK